MSTSVDRETIASSYNDVRSDASEINWMVLKYNGTAIEVNKTGEDFGEFHEQFADHERAFGFIRIQTGDEMSKRSKFVLVTWCGQDVQPLKRARMSTDKSLVKDVISNFAVEIQAENSQELDYDTILGLVVKAGGANYGTGIRD